MFINLPIIYLIFEFDLLVNSCELFNYCFRNEIDNRNGDLSSPSRFKRNRGKEEMNQKKASLLVVIQHHRIHENTSLSARISILPPV
jgi:hypothetical protein